MGIKRLVKLLHFISFYCEQAFVFHVPHNENKCNILKNQAYLTRSSKKCTFISTLKVYENWKKVQQNVKSLIVLVSCKTRQKYIYFLKISLVPFWLFPSLVRSGVNHHKVSKRKHTTGTFCFWHCK